MTRCYSGGSRGYPRHDRTLDKTLNPRCRRHHCAPTSVCRPSACSSANRFQVHPQRVSPHTCLTGLKRKEKRPEKILLLHVLSTALVNGSDPSVANFGKKEKGSHGAPAPEFRLSRRPKKGQSLARPVAVCGLRARTTGERCNSPQVA